MAWIFVVVTSGCCVRLCFKKMQEGYNIQMMETYAFMNPIYNEHFIYAPGGYQSGFMKTNSQTGKHL